MKTLVVTLKQHTPLIHFQHDQEGATLRASEVKPKLDRYILTKLGKGDYEEGLREAKKMNWLIGKGDYPALDFKVRIVSQEKINDFHLKSYRNNKGKWTTEKFPLLLANMGGQDCKEDLMNLIMYRSNKIYLYCVDSKLYEKLKKLMPYFMENTNFGQRSNKGFGSFTVKSIEGECGKKTNISDSCIEGNPSFMDFCLIKEKDVNDLIYSLSIQKKLFSVIERFWNKLREYVNEDQAIEYDIIDSVESYIKGMKYVQLDQDQVSRFPAPVMFKPIIYTTKCKDGNEELGCNIYIMFDSGFMQRLRNKYSNQINVNGFEVKIDHISDLEYIDSFIETLLHEKYINWRENINKEWIRIEFYKENED